MATSSAAVIGSTGLVGSNILSTLLAVDTYNTVNTITRRAPKTASARLNALVDADTTKWAAALTDLKPAPATVFSALGTTAAAAGSIANQWKIDHDLNVELAKAAKAAGTQSYVFVSSGGTRSWFVSRSPYAKMKNGVEDAIRDLDFEHAIILKPGLIIGHREESRATEGYAQTVVNLLGSVSAGLKNKIGQDAEVIAKAAVRAAQLADEGKAPSKYWIVTADEIIKLGKTEWPGKDAVAPPAAPEATQAGAQ